MRAWIVRAGVHGERDDWALTNGLAGGGFREVRDLTGVVSREAMAEVTATSYPDAKAMAIANYTGQLWALRQGVEPGDLVVLPLKPGRRGVALGVCTGGYEYHPDDDEDRRHRVHVDWRRTDVPRAAFKDDLLATLNGAMTIFQARNNNAVARLQAVLDGGTDPGATGPQAAAAAVTAADPVVEGDTAGPVLAFTPEAIRDRVQSHLVENFGQHKLTGLVADILRAEGYTCDVSAPGPDFGVDILAGRGPLGLDSPTVVVEVKSEQGQIGSPVLNQLLGAVNNHSADQGLLVAWGGLTKQAEALHRNQRLKVRVWTADDVLDHLFEVYDRLPDRTRAEIPLRRAWVLLDETG